MSESQLAAPELVELLSTDEVSSLVGATQRELAALEQRVAQARAAADELERRARSEGADERSSTWAIVRMQRFVDGLREEAERDAETVVDAARRRARAHVDPIVDHPLAWDEVPPRTREVTRPEVPPAAPPPAPQFMPVSPVVSPAPIAGLPVTPLVPVADAPATPPSLQWSPIEDGIAESNGVSRAAVEATGIAPAALVVPEPAPEVPAAPVAQVERTNRGFMRGFPLSAVLEVIAVLLVLLFILLRLS